MQDVQENDMQIKCVTVDLGKERKRVEKVYHTEELCEIIKEKYALEGYELMSAPKKLARHKGACKGEFVFGKFTKTSKTAVTPKKTETIAEVVVSKKLGTKSSTKTTKKAKASKTKRQTTKSVATEE